MNPRCFLTVILVLVLLSLPAFGLGIYPTRYVFVSSHGETREGSFLIANDGGSDMPVSVEISKGVKSNENEFLSPPEEWLKTEATDFVLGPKEKRNIHFQVTVPTGTSGMFSARISFVDKSQQAYSTALTVPVYVVIEGTEIVDWSIEELVIKNTPVGLSGSFVVENRGNVMFYANGGFVVRDRKGREVYSTEAGGRNVVFPERRVLIPLDVRELDIKPGKYVAEIRMAGYDNIEKVFKFRIKKTRQGKYEIKLF